MRTPIHLLVFAVIWPVATAAPAQALRFGVLNQRSPQMAAQYWNPILFVAAQNSDCDNYRQFYRSTRVRPAAP